jgi:hypothetical protein
LRILAAAGRGKIDFSQESLQLTDVGWLGMGEHCLHVTAQGLNPGGRPLVSQKLNGGCGKHAFLCVDNQTRITQAGVDCPKMLQVLLLVLAGDDDIVQVAEDERKLICYRLG